ncbi:MAG: protein kinase [bacterium]|nr:protein kinase [bacterium]
MGEVLKAFDDRLDRWVAIKRIRPGKESAEKNRERFQREAWATARLNHPAIVHVYDIFQDGDSDCIVMEFVDGQTLHSLGSKAPLDPQQAAGLGCEIAEGLAEAHGKGILHRDLKTENIIVTPEGRAKILDFGLAKPLRKTDLAPSLTSQGQLLGTSRAMAPEYIGGDPVDHRADLFALGVLLYEIVTGHSPFKAQNTLATLRKVIVHQQPPTRELNLQVPPVLSDLIDGLLEKSPGDRPQTAREVADALRRIAGQSSAAGLLPPAASLVQVRRTPALRSLGTMLAARRYWIPLLIIIAIGLIGAYFLGTRRSSESLFFEAGDRMVIATFENLTGEPILDDSLDFAFRSDLEWSRHANVLSETQVQDALIRMERDPDTRVDRLLGREICQREGAKALVIGSVEKADMIYVLHAEVIDAHTGDTFYQSERAADRSALLTAIERLTQAIRAYLGESSEEIESARPPEKATTYDLGALHAYTLGLAKIAEGNDEAAAQHLERAIELDPAFVMARTKLDLLRKSLDREDARTQGL